MNFVTSDSAQVRLEAGEGQEETNGEGKVSLRIKEKGRGDR